MSAAYTGSAELTLSHTLHAYSMFVFNIKYLSHYSLKQCEIYISSYQDRTLVLEYLLTLKTLKTI